MDFYTLDKAIEKLADFELLSIDMINVQTKEAKVCISISDMAEFRAECEEYKNSDFIYTSIPMFDNITIDDIVNVEADDEITF
jgi:hypothetical protein